MKSFWDKIAPLYDAAEALNNKVYSKMLSYAVSLVPEGAKVLECAAGTGAISAAVSKKAAHITCTDLSLPMLEQARKKFRAKGITNITLEERDIFNLSDEDETYDVVIAANVLHLLDDPQAAVKELMRTVKKGGRLIVPTFITSKPDNREMTAIKLYRLFGFNPAAHYNADTYFEMLKSCKTGGRLRMRVISGLIPCAFAVIEKN